MKDSLFKENIDVDSQKRKRKKKRASKPKFMEYNQHQIMLLPPSIEEMIPEKHIVRTVNKVIETMNIEALINTYKGGGRSSYDPQMLLKVLVYAYVMKLYSSRRISKALREDINFMWISGMQKPDFRTINNFRSGRLKEVIDKVFSSMIIFLTDNKYIKLEDYFVDGTKIEANANKYSYVWSKNTQRYKAMTKDKIKELLKQIERINQQEEKEYGEKDLEELGDEAEISSEKIEKQVEKLNKIISQIGENSKDKNSERSFGKDKNSRKKKRKLKSAVNKLNKKYLPKLRKYEEQETIEGLRSSYSKTDKDATFFMDKEKQYRPSYNIIIGTEEQLILNYSLHQKASETDKFISHMKKLRQMTGGKNPNRAIGDGTYGSEENYNFLKKEKIVSYLKYPGFYQEVTGKAEKNRFGRINFRYKKQEDKIYCPEGRQMSVNRIEEKITDNGYKQVNRIYKGDCRGCEYLSVCSKSARGRTVQLNKKLEKYKRLTKKNLCSPQGIELRKKRNVDVETVFGDIKQNQGFRRFNLRGLEKVNAEFGLVAIAHNIKKVGTMIN
jgi:transposase